MSKQSKNLGGNRGSDKNNKLSKSTPILLRLPVAVDQLIDLAWTPQRSAVVDCWLVKRSVWEARA